MKTPSFFAICLGMIVGLPTVHNTATASMLAGEVEASKTSSFCDRALQIRSRLNSANSQAAKEDRARLVQDILDDLGSLTKRLSTNDLEKVPLLQQLANNLRLDLEKALRAKLKDLIATDKQKDLENLLYSESEMELFLSQALQQKELELVVPNLNKVTQNSNWPQYIAAKRKELALLFLLGAPHTEGESLLQDWGRYSDQRKIFDPQYANRVGTEKFSELNHDQQMRQLATIAEEYEKQIPENDQKRVRQLKFLDEIELSENFLRIVNGIFASKETKPVALDDFDRRVLNKIRECFADPQTPCYQDVYELLLPDKETILSAWQLRLNKIALQNTNEQLINDLIHFLEFKEFPTQTYADSVNSRPSKLVLNSYDDFITHYADRLTFHNQAGKELKAFIELGARHREKLQEVLDDLAAQNEVSDAKSMAAGFGTGVFEGRIVVIGVHYRVIYRRGSNQKPFIFYIGKRENLNTSAARNIIKLRLN